MAKKKRFLQSGIVALIVLLFTGYLYSLGNAGKFYFAELPFQDILRSSKLAIERQPDDRIKILKIDAPSLTEVGRFPWDRAVYAKMIEKLEKAGARAIGVDVVFSEASRDPADDKALADVLAKYDNIVLATQIDYPAKQTSTNVLVPTAVEYPVDSLHAKPSQTATINVMPDEDSKVRRLSVGLPDMQGKMLPAFSVALANYLLPEGQKIHWDDAKKQWMRGSAVIPTNGKYQVLTEFYSEPRQKIDAQTGYESVSFSDVYSGRIELPVEGAVVLIGPFETGLQDEYLTPESSTVKMFGVEIHANMLQSLLEGKFYQEIGKVYGLLVLLVLCLLSFVLFERFRGRTSIGIFIVLMILYGVSWVLIYTTYHLLIPLTYPLLAIILLYVWSTVSHYLAERRERGRVTNIFGRFVPKTVVDEILASGEEVKLGGQRRDITLIFVDIRGFTPMSEKLEPEQVIQILNEYLDVCTRAIFKFNGTLDKFIGDAVMAIFGAPIPMDNHPEMAVRAALEMKRQSAVLEQKLIERTGIGVRFGLGINSGPAVVGNIGSEELRLDYTAIGDTVNLAARLESNAKPGQILISVDTYERVKHLFEIEPVGEIKVKGKELPVMVYEVMGEKAASDAEGSKRGA